MSTRINTPIGVHLGEKSKYYALNKMTQSVLLSLIGGIGCSSLAYAETIDDDNSVIQLETVVVTAQPFKKKAVNSGTLGSRSDLETPFSAYQVTSQAIEEKQAKSIAKLFEAEAGVEAKGGTYGLRPDALSVRGLPLDFVNGYKIDGHPFQMASVELPLELFEQVQLLKGATGFLYGIGSPGGTVNYITKKPTDSKKLSLSLGYSSDSIFSQHIDVGDHFGQDEQFGYRFNVVNEKGQAYNGTEVDRQAVSLYLDVQVTPDLKVYANGFFQQRDLEGGITSFSVANAGNYAFSGTELPKAISGRKNLTGYDSSYYNSTAWAAATGLTWQINDQWTFDTSYSHTFKRIDSRDETIFLRNAQGDYNLSLRQFYRPTLIFDSVQSRLEGIVQTGWLKHKLVAGVDYQQQTRDLNIGNPNLDPTVNQGGQNHSYPANFPAGNLYGSALSLDYNGYSPREYFRISDWTTKSYFISDTLSIDDQWSLLLGLRKFDYKNDNYFVAGNKRNPTYRQNPISPTIAFLFTPRVDTTFYASYVESLEDGGNVGNTYANAYDQLDAIESKQYELGVKTEHENWAISSALFRIERGTGYADTQNFYRGDGVARYDGFEFSGRYKTENDLSINASASLIDGEFTEAAPTIVGKAPTALAKFQGSLGLAKEFSDIPGLRVHGNINHVGKQYINNANSIQTPSFEVVSIGGSYRVPLGQNQLTYRAEISNLFDKNYWVASSNALAVGSPRTLSLNLSYEF